MGVFSQLGFLLLWFVGWGMKPQNSSGLHCAITLRISPFNLSCSQQCFSIVGDVASWNLCIDLPTAFLFFPYHFFQCKHSFFSFKYSGVFEWFFGKGALHACHKGSNPARPRALSTNCTHTWVLEGGIHSILYTM